ncbi:MAG TPA: MlaD family protein [Longimicrobiales bacterium]|nr:MlaD family protein [Longimicrobiales bacterium]
MAATTAGQRFHWQRWRVAVLIVVSMLLLAYGVKRVGAVFDVFASRYELVTLVPSALGLREGAPVTLAGQRIGQVKRIEFIPVERKIGNHNLRLVLAISEDVSDQIRADSRAFLRTMGLLGDKFVDIAPGTGGARILQTGDTIASGKSLDLDEFIMQASGALEQATGIVTNLQELTGGLTRGEGTAGRMLTDDALYVSIAATTAELRSTLAHINRADGTFSRLLNDPTLYYRLHGAIARVDSLGGLILHGNGTMGQLLRSDSAYRHMMGTLTTADSAVTDLATLVRGMTTGNGTLQRLMSEPQLYDEFLKAVIDAQTLINDIRLHPAKYKPIIRVDIF